MGAAPAHAAATPSAPQQNRKRALAKPRQRAGGRAITLLTVVRRPVGGIVLRMFFFLFRVGLRAPSCAGRAARQKERRPKRMENQRQREAKPTRSINTCARVCRPVGGGVFDMFSFVSCGGVRVRLRVGRAALEKERGPQRSQNKTGRGRNVCSHSGVSESRPRRGAHNPRYIRRF